MSTELGGDGLPDPTEFKPVPSPETMSRAEKKKYGVREVSPDKYPDLPAEAAGSTVWAAENYPVNVFEKPKASE
ncbi:hypothetical protein [Natronomonas sp. EA1]|uniref:hypothetical protein n=1 Tax=Natronomonas sp. EA1 TaxID=3421655 RepID=UPI003EB70820